MAYAQCSRLFTRALLGRVVARLVVARPSLLGHVLGVARPSLLGRARRADQQSIAAPTSGR